MTCKACGSSEGLQACLYCGHEVCALHRGELGGVAACTPCLREEHERKQASKQAAAAPAAPATPARGAAPARVADPAAVAADVRPGPEPSPRPLPEPKGMLPLLAGLAAGAAAGGYAYWFLGRLLLEGPAWAPGAGAGAIALVACAGVWAIVKSR